MIRAYFATLIVAFIFWFARRFYTTQNQGKMLGGPVSTPKALWLGYAVGSWYFIPLLFLTWSEVHPSLKLIFALHLLSWWIRAPIELVMIYKFLNWTPKYGITHDALHIVMILSFYFFKFGLFTDELLTPANQLSLVYIAVTIFALIMEISFAHLFRKARGKDENAHLIYFASDDPHYKFINRLTLYTVIIVYVHLALQLWAFYAIAISNPGA